MAEEPTLIKLTLIGPKKTGKTSLLRRFIDHTFDLNSKPTSGVDFGTKIYSITGPSEETVALKAQIWDTAGDSFLTPTALGNTAAVGIVLTPDADQTVDMVTARKYYAQAKQEAPNDVPIYFIINKTDLFPGLNKQATIDNITKQFPGIDQSAILFHSAKDDTDASIEQLFKTIGAGGYNAWESVVSGISTKSTKPIPILPVTERREQITEKAREEAVVSVSAPKSGGGIADYKIELGGNAFIIIAAIVALAVLAALPIGGLPLLAGLTVLGAAAIAAGTVFVLWNLGCFIKNVVAKSGSGGDPKLTQDGQNAWSSTSRPNPASDQPQPEIYESPTSNPSGPATDQTPKGPGETPGLNNKQ